MSALTEATADEKLDAVKCRDDVGAAETRLSETKKFSKIEMRIVKYPARFKLHHRMVSRCSVPRKSSLYPEVRATTRVINTKNDIA